MSNNCCSNIFPILDLYTCPTSYTNSTLDLRAVYSFSHFSIRAKPDHQSSPVLFWVLVLAPNAFMAALVCPSFTVY